MEAFRVLEHTADVGFEAFGATRAEVFVNAARALQDLSVDLGSIEARETLAVEVNGDNATELLVNWLSQLLFLVDAEGWVFRHFEIASLQETALNGSAQGEKFDRARHQIKLQVKAITYHQLALEQTSQGWRAQVYVDI
ncbi:MAG TPA: archease [Terriglobia bacterium]|nr:archease [Terriglobia bacterium]